jgi:DedD protein
MGPLPGRNTRRSEKKLTRLPLLLLVVVLCLASFFTGVWIGRGQQSVTVEVQSPPPSVAERPQEAPASPPVPPAGNGDLSFFETLSKGEQSPLGSGINLPPAGGAPHSEISQPAPGPSVVDSAVVKVTAPAPPAPQTAKIDATGSYLVQAASFAKANEAQALYDRLIKKNHPVFIQPAQLGERGIWYRVMLGPFDNVSAAERMVARLQVEEKLSAMVRKH